MMIIDKEIRELISKIETSGKLQPYFSNLIETLYHNCINNNVQKSTSAFKPYPVETYAVSLDPLNDEEQILEYWQQFGFVVSKNVVSDSICQNAISYISKLLTDLKVDTSNPLTYIKDSFNTPLISRGFLEIYHDNFIAQIRQSLRLYLHHVILWNSPFLWTSFDRIGIKPPIEESSLGLPLHVDQNPIVDPGFKTMQGVIALDDCPQEIGTFIGVPSSMHKFYAYEKFVPKNYIGEYLPLPLESELYQEFNSKKQLIPIKKGCIVSWDSRTTHANSPNTTQDKIRYVAYVSTGLAKENEIDTVKMRKESFMSGLGQNQRAAYMHASKKPRFTDVDFIRNHRVKEKLNELGLCLYGLDKYENIIKR